MNIMAAKDDSLKLSYGFEFDDLDDLMTTYLETLVVAEAWVDGNPKYTYETKISLGEKEHKFMIIFIKDNAKEG